MWLIDFSYIEIIAIKRSFFRSKFDHRIGFEFEQKQDLCERLNVYFVFQLQFFLAFQKHVL